MKSIRQLVAVLLVFACLAAVGCTAIYDPAKTTSDAKSQATAATCSANRAQVDSEYAMAQSGALGGAPASYESVVAKSGKCPSGGTYAFDAASQKTICSVHSK